MQRKRLALVLSILLILGLALSGCAARPGQGELAASATAESLVVDVPALVVTYDDQGKASFSGVELSVLGAALGQDLSVLDRSPELMAKLQKAGIQHVFANITPDGLTVYANGRPILNLAWTPERLAKLGELLASMDNPSLAQVQGLLPLLSNLSAGIVMHFPTAEGTEELPLVGEPVDSKAVLDAAKKAAPAALAAVLPDNMKGQAPLLGSLVANLPPLTITFDDKGVGTLQGLSPMILGMIPADAISLPADALATLTDLKIQALNIKSSADGLTLSINGNELPTILWSGGEMQHLAELGIAGGVLEVLANLDEGLLGTLKQVTDAAPLLQTAKLDVTINLPQ